MKTENLDGLSRIVDAEFRISQSRFQEIAKEEVRLRSLLRELDTKELQGRTVLSADPTIRTFGGDVSWHLWIGQSREKLNMQLAALLARKEAVHTAYQRSFGKQMTVSTLHERNQRVNRQKGTSDTLRRLGELFLVQNQAR